MTYEEVARAWEPVDRAAGRRLTEARLQCHWAVQTAAAFAVTTLKTHPDDSQTSCDWIDATRRFASQAGADGTRIVVAPVDLTVSVVRSDGKEKAFALDGKTLADALTWVTEQIGCDKPLELPTYDMPSHPVMMNRPFSAADSASREELARYYANATRLLAAVCESTANASPVRLWPHHFDIATLIELDPDESDSEKARTIGVGLSPGDDTYDEPYFYVNPWPYPKDTDLPELEGDAVWYTTGWVGATLPSSRLVHGAPTDQADQVRAYVHSAIRHCRTLLRQG